MQTSTHRRLARPLLLALTLVGIPLPARADIFGADVPVLVNLLANSFQELHTLQEGIKTARETYDETKRLAGYAQEAAQAFKGFQKSKGAALFSDNINAALDSAFPDLAYFRAEAARTGPWAQANGELGRLVRLCLSGGSGSCIQVQEALTLQSARASVSATFGTASPKDLQARILDDQAAVSLSMSSAQAGRSALARAKAEELMRQCTLGGNLAACQAAAAAAEIAGLEQSADIADHLAQANTLQAMQLAERNGARKQEQADAQARHHFLESAAKTFGAGPPSVKTEGFNLFEEGGN